MSETDTLRRGYRWAYGGAAVVAIAAVIVAAFWPVTQAQFLNWDDPQTVVHNPFIRGMGGEQLAWMFGRSYHTGHYHPLTWLSFAMDYQVWGLEAAGFHITNLLLHVINAMLVLVLGYTLLQRSRPTDETDATADLRTLSLACGAAMLFAVHPLRVESVAWVTERRDLLSACFFLLAVLAYCKAASARTAGEALRRRRMNWKWAAMAWLLMGACLLSKAIGVVLPFVFLLLDWYPLRHWRIPARRDQWHPTGDRTRGGVHRTWTLLLEKWPFFALAVPFAVIAVQAQRHVGALHGLGEYPIAQRLTQAATGLHFYVEKLVMPIGLSPLYDLSDTSRLRVLIGVAFSVSACVVAIVFRKRYPSIAAAWFGYVLLLIPVLGFAQSGQQAVADRYSYLACLGPLWLVAGGVGSLLRRTRTGRGRMWAVAVAGVAIVGLAWQTNGRCRVWHDSVTLWSDAVTTTPNSSWAHVNLGDALGRRGAWSEAATAFARGVELDPHDKKALNGLAAAILNTQGRRATPDPLSLLQRAVELDPDYVDARCNLASVLAFDGRDEEAIAQYRAAISADPSSPGSYYGLGGLLYDRRREREAVEVLRIGAERIPSHAPMAAQLAWLLATSPLGDLRDGGEAVRLAQGVCQTADPDDARAYQTLAVAWAESGDFERAIEAATTARRRAVRVRDDGLVEQLDRQLTLFGRGQPYHRACHPQAIDANGGRTDGSEEGADDDDLKP
ncbi:MAG: tetratricopeptide repeat protein [Planctomycetes bacterium]|nr:tetratricopeptide repeat protein [Planctomycetota bacterium]